MNKDTVQYERHSTGMLRISMQRQRDVVVAKRAWEIEERSYRCAPNHLSVEYEMRVVESLARQDVLDSWNRSSSRWMLE